MEEYGDAVSGSYQLLLFYVHNNIACYFLCPSNSRLGSYVH